MGQDFTSYHAALYMRLSKDDYNKEESSSITTQRKILTSFAKENSFKIVDEYVDDGWSGTNFNRPEFKRMIQDIENKKINLVITKDLSRLGRDYITTGQYTEIYFPSKKVRYIAINDGFDSNNKYTDIAPFKNLINEMYARDLSQKIKSSFQAKMKDGSFIGNFAPYGYIKDPNNKNHLLINTEVSEIVKKIFNLALNGHSPKQIADYLNGQNIESPLLYRCNKYHYLDIKNYKNTFNWTPSTISKILKNVVYLGHTAQGKTSKISFKSKLTVQNSKDDWIIVKNTHEPIINENAFNEIKKLSLNRTCNKKGKFTNIFSGFAKCMDCGKNMSSVGTRKKGSVANLACGNYKIHGKNTCSNHFIDYNILYDIVFEALKTQMHLTEKEKKQLFEEIRQKVNLQQKNLNFSNDLKKLKSRVIKLDSIIEKLYEDKMNGIINNARFKKLIDKYEKETELLNKKIHNLEVKLDFNSTYHQETELSSYEEFSKLLDKYFKKQNLNKEILFKFIDHIEISQGHYEKTQNGKIKHQKIKIYFKLSGKSSTRLYKK